MKIFEDVVTQRLTEKATIVDNFLILALVKKNAALSSSTYYANA